VRLCMASRTTSSNNMMIQLLCIGRGGQSTQEGQCHRIDATLARANSTAIWHSGITTKTLTKMNVCVSQFPILCKPMPRPPIYRPPILAIAVRKHVASSHANDLSTIWSSARLGELNTFSTRGMQ